MKRKFRNSKDFQSLEKVKKDLMRFSQINICNNLELLLSILPKYIYQEKIFLPTKNMMNFLLVRLQGVGKILCRVVEMCKLTVKYYECRLYLGHFWRLALVAIGLASRIHVLTLNNIKFTCLLYIRLLPFSHKLKNSGAEWLPKDYVFPKDLKEWLNIEWEKLDEVIEVEDTNFKFNFIDLIEDSDDDVQFCKEYIELNEDEDEDFEIMKEFKKINKRVEPIEYKNNLTVFRGFSSRDIDLGEPISSDEKEEVNSNEEFNTNANLRIYLEDEQIPTIEGDDIGEIISSLEEHENSQSADMNKCSETNIDGCRDVQEGGHNSSVELKNKQTEVQIVDDNVLISSTDDNSSDDSVKFVEEVRLPCKRQAMVTSDFIPFNGVNDFQTNEYFQKIISCSKNKKSFHKNNEDLGHLELESQQLKCPYYSKSEMVKKNPTQKTPNKRKKKKTNGEKHHSIIEITDTPQTFINTRINHVQVNNNEIIENNGNSSIESIHSNVGSHKRKKEWDTHNESRKKPRGSEGTTMEIIDANHKIVKNNKFSKHIKNSINRNLSGLLEISGNNISENEHTISQSGNEFIDVTDCSLNSICNTSTPVKKRKRKQIKTRNSALLSKEISIEIDNSVPGKQKSKNINLKRKNKKQKKTE